MIQTEHSYRVCTRCVMDTSAADITFDENGVCNYCTEFLERSSNVLFKDPRQRENEKNAFVEKVRTQGKGKPYDCVIGISGGVDSSWVLVQAIKLGLRPLAVHMDNGWNSELAQNNIANLVRGLGVDLYTHVIDWDEYRKLMQAFFDADVIEVELLYDNALKAVNFQQASLYKLTNILAGSNQATEGMRKPSEWGWFKLDKRNIKALGKRFSNVRLKSFPAVGTLGFIYYTYFKKIKWVPFLDFFDYNKFEALDILENDYGFKRYPYKHYESVFTRFFQGYILPNKFKVDKRRMHFSSLIISGQMKREDALSDLEGIPYHNEKTLEEDLQYFLKKMGWSREELTEYINRPEIPHSDYPTEKPLKDFLVKYFRSGNQ